VGTPSYIAPEQAAGGRPVDGRADLYALGVILFEMLSGLQPFTAESHRALYFEHLYTPAPRLDVIVPDADIDPEVVDLVDTLLAKRPEDRPASANLVTRTIEAILSRLGLPVEETGIRPVRHPSAERPAVPDAADDWDGADRWRRRTHRQVVARLAIVGVVLAGLVAAAIAMGWCAA
jgi:serine/threonine-protein kinase